VRAIESGREFPVFVQEYECDIRQRLTRLAFNEDAWFDLDHQVPKTARDITRYMDSLGLPFLEEFESYHAVLAVLDKRARCRFPMKVALPWSAPWSVCISSSWSAHVPISTVRPRMHQRTRDLPGTLRTFSESADCSERYSPVRQRSIAPHFEQMAGFTATPHCTPILPGPNEVHDPRGTESHLGQR
jgi:hypothetical protein